MGRTISFSRISLLAVACISSFSAISAGSEKREYKGVTESIAVKSYQEAVMAIKSADAVVMGLFYDEKDYAFKDFSAATMALPDNVVKFYHSFDPVIHDKYEKTCEDMFPCIFISRGFDPEGTVRRNRDVFVMHFPHDEWTPYKMVEWIAHVMLPDFTFQPNDSPMGQAQFNFAVNTQKAMLWHIVGTRNTQILPVADDFKRAAALLHQNNFSCVHYQVDEDIEEGRQAFDQLFEEPVREETMEFLMNGGTIWIYSDVYDNLRSERRDLDYDTVMAYAMEFLKHMSPRPLFKLRSGFQKPAKVRAEAKAFEKEQKKERKAKKAAKKAEKKAKREAKKKAKAEKAGLFDEL